MLPISEDEEVTLTDVTLIQDFDETFISVTQLVDKGAHVNFGKDHCEVLLMLQTPSRPGMQTSKSGTKDLDTATLQ